MLKDESVNLKSINSNNYKLEQLEYGPIIGTGTFGRVVLAKDKLNKNQYALKIMTISEILRLKQSEHVKSEKEILTTMKHPFIVDLLWTHHSDKYLYMLLEYVSGGELFSLLREAGKFDVETTRFYASEIVCALEYLHLANIAYRDLKPENILLDIQGHIKLTDFGFAKRILDRSWTLCGTPEYLSPEIILSKGHNKAVDWWALGVLIYEMLTGFPPFFGENPFQIYEKIIIGKIIWPEQIDSVAKHLIKKLLAQDRTKRLGNMKNGAIDIKNHKWFNTIDWNSVAGKMLQPPIVPKNNQETESDQLTFENNFPQVKAVSNEELLLFENF